MRKTNRVVVAEEGWKYYGTGQGIAALIYEHGFDYLDAPVGHVTGKDVPMPYSKVVGARRAADQRRRHRRRQGHRAGAHSSRRRRALRSGTMHTVVMPKLSDTMEEGKILSWLKQEGDPVAKGDSLAEIETEKVNIEVEAFSAGVLRKILVPAGTSAAVGAPIALTGAASEPIPAEFASAATSQKAAEMAMPIASSAPAASAAAAPMARPMPRQRCSPRPSRSPPRLARRTARHPRRSPATATATARRATATRASVEQVNTANGRIFISPIARHIAAEHNIDLATLTGSGPYGRIIRDDVEAYLERQRAEAQPTFAARECFRCRLPHPPRQVTTWRPCR